MKDINRIAELVELGIEPSKIQGDYTVYLKNEVSKHYVYSKYNPRKTAKDLIDLENTNEETIWIIFGIGLGYVAEEILKVTGTKCRIIIIEPTNELFEKQSIYIGKLLENKGISIFYGNDKRELNNILDENIKVKDINNIKVIVQPVYRHYFKDYYEVILTIISEYIENLKVTYNTVIAFSHRNLSNIIKNQESIKNSYDITLSKDQYKDIPAVIVSAGPSLNKNIKELKGFEGIVFTGTRTLCALKEIGVTPDYLACVDPGEIACDIMREHKENNIALIATEEASPQVVRNNKGNKYFVKGMANGLSKQLYGVEVPRLPLHGSVATLCLSAAQFMGCNPIIFIGQDLAYTEVKAHAEDYNSYKVDLEDPHIRYVASSDGTLLPTDVTLVSFLRWIETFIAEDKNKTRYINCTEGGAHISGTENALLKEIVSQYKSSYPIKEIEMVKIQSGSGALKDDVRLELKDYMETLKLGEKYTAELLNEYIKGNSQRTKELLEALEEQVNSKLYEVNGLFEMILTIERLKIEANLKYKRQFNDTQGERDTKNVQKYLTLYRNTNEAIQKVLEIINL